MDSGPSQIRNGGPSSPKFTKVKLRSSDDGMGGDAPPRYTQPNRSSLEGHDKDPHDAGKPLLGSNGSEDRRPRSFSNPTSGDMRISTEYDHSDHTDGGMGGGGMRAETLAQRKALWWRNALITGIFIMGWYGFATLLSLYNKWMFSPDYYGFSYPLFVTFCHMIVQFVLAGIIRLFFPRFRPQERPTRQDYVVKILPAAVSTGGDIGLSNLSLKTITLSLYTMCKSSTLIFVLLFAFVFHLEHYSLRLVGVISLIFFGVFLMVFDTTAVSIPGVIMVFSASALSGLRWALTETIMHKKAMGLSNPFATIFWLAPLMALTLGLISLMIEDWTSIFGQGHFDGMWRSVKTVAVIVFPGAIAFSMVTSEYFIIQRAGMVPLSVAGIFKEVSTISFSAWLFGDTLTPPNIIGVGIATLGITLYTYHKYQRSISTPSVSSPIKEVSDTSPLVTSSRVLYAPPPGEDLTPPSSPRPAGGGLAETVAMSPLKHQTPKAIARNQYPPVTTHETNAERTERLRDEFEGWNNEEWSDDEDEEADEEEVAKRRSSREGLTLGEDGTRGGGNWLTRSWGPWWAEKL